MRNEAESTQPVDTPGAGCTAVADAEPRRLTIWPKRWIYLALATAVLAAGRSFGLAWVHAVGLAAAALLVLESLLRQLVARRMQRFERQLAVAFQRQDVSQMAGLYRSQLLLRLVAPRAQLLGKLGWIEHRIGRHRAAEQSFRDALEEARPSEAPLLAHRLADVLYAQQRWIEAERFYRIAQDGSNGVNPGTQARIARLIRQRDGDLAEAEGFLRRAVEAAQGRPGCGLFRCELIEVLVALNSKDDAIGQLQIAEEELANASGEEQRSLEAARAAVGTLTS